MSSKILRFGLALFLVLGVCVAPVLADTGSAGSGASIAPAEDAAPVGIWKPLAAIGAGLATIGGAYGIGRLAQSAMEGTARQPEAGGQIRTSMIIAAALIEGFTFFALIVCIIAAG